MLSIEALEEPGWTLAFWSMGVSIGPLFFGAMECQILFLSPSVFSFFKKKGPGGKGGEEEEEEEETHGAIQLTRMFFGPAS